MIEVRRRAATARDSRADLKAVPRVLAALREQCPELLTGTVREIPGGQDNRLFRIGSELVLRLPRHDLAEARLRRECEVLERLPRVLPLEIARLVHAGLPGDAIERHWSVQTWHPGRSAWERAPVSDSGEALAAFLARLHVDGPAIDPFASIERGNRSEVDRRFRRRLVRLKERIGAVHDTLLELCADGVPPPCRPPADCIHGDLHAGNVVVRGGCVRAVIDWGEVASGDVTEDLASIWHVLPHASQRSRARARYGGTGALWRRARYRAADYGLRVAEFGLRRRSALHWRRATTLLVRLHDDRHD